MKQMQMSPILYLNNNGNINSKVFNVRQRLREVKQSMHAFVSYAPPRDTLVDLEQMLEVFQSILHQFCLFRSALIFPIDASAHLGENTHGPLNYRPFYLLEGPVTVDQVQRPKMKCLPLST